jgi:hypothetical protein
MSTWRAYHPETPVQTSNPEDINTRPEDITDTPAQINTGKDDWTVEVEPS